LTDYNNEFTGIKCLLEDPSLSADELTQKLSDIVARQGKLTRLFEEVYPPKQYPVLYTDETRTKVTIINSVAQQLNELFHKGHLDRKRSRWFFQVAYTVTHTPIRQQQEEVQKKIRRKRILF
jgi:hypothetical protein